MQRATNDLESGFDLLVVGGGVWGASIARHAALFGLNTALIERGDFCCGTSHNSLKILHGGFRYLQHLDVPRIVESVAAQRHWLSIAPHLTRPMQCVMPTYGFGTRGPFALGAALAAYSLLAARRNRNVPEVGHRPLGGLMSRKRTFAKLGQIPAGGITGGAYWYDAQVLDTNRLVLECIADFATAGGVAANYVSAVAPIGTSRAVIGVRARDEMTGREFEIRARMTVLAAGEGNDVLLREARAMAGRSTVQSVWTKSINLVIAREPREFAFGIASNRASDAVIGKSRRLFFLTPWRDRTVVGTAHVAEQGQSGPAASAETVVEFMTEVNAALPALELEPEDIVYVHAGLTPGESDGLQDTGNQARSRRKSIVDHERAEGFAGLLTVTAPKLTTASHVGLGIARYVARSLGRPVRGPIVARPLNNTPEIAELAHDQQRPASTAADVERQAIRFYGKNSSQVLQMAEREPDESLRDYLFRCRLRWALRHEMAMRLDDVLLRRTDLAERGHLERRHVQWAANEMARAHGWNGHRAREEIERVRVAWQTARPHIAAQHHAWTDLEYEFKSNMGNNR